MSAKDSPLAHATEHASAEVQPDPTEILTVAQAALYLKVSKQALYEAVAANQVPHRRLGQRIIFSRHALIAWAHGPR